FIGGSGFHNDISAFEAWALTLTEHPLNQFYASTSFADYPPGYFFVLLVVGWIFKGLVALHVVARDAYGVLGMLAKLPAIAMDLVDAYLIYAIVRRVAARPLALTAAALFALNPAAIYVSAYWGQVDSVSWGLILLGLNLLLSARGDVRGGAVKIAGAWLALGFSILMKPQGTFVAFVFLAFAAVAATPGERRRRVLGTAAGIAGAFALAFVAAALFHGTLNPVADFTWLFGRYAYGSAVYPYNTINAFNLYAIAKPFWQPDQGPLTISLLFLHVTAGSMLVWGWILVAGAAALVVARYVQRKDDAALLEAAMLVSFGFFVLATRMHERYVYGAFLLMMPLVAFGRRYLWAAPAISVTLLVNLAYSLHYQTVMEQKVIGVDASNLWPLVTHPLSALNVALFFFLGYVFLGGAVTEWAGADGAATSSAGARAGAATKRAWLRARTWFDPREGIACFHRWDWALAVAFTVASFALCIVRYSYPAERYFDEVYYPRAGEEYLQHKEIFEFTHPPLTKLIITLSMILVGHGDGLSALGNSGAGWRFLNIVLGALTVGVLYAFAKRLTSSTLFASVAAGLLLLDGFHYVQSRIATPEITVSFFSICTLYAFYRLWLATQVARRPVVDARVYRRAFAGVIAAGTLLSVSLSVLLTNWRTPTSGYEFRSITYAVVFLYFEALCYLAARTLLPRILINRGNRAVYAEGTVVRVADGEVTGRTLDGIALAGKPQRLRDDGATRVYDRDGTLTYETRDASATFTPAGILSVGGVRIDARDGRRWLFVLAAFGALLAASKWNGLFDFFVVWGLAAAVFAQRWFRRPAVFGNPFGMPLDVLVLTMLCIGGAVYTACYIPYFTLGHNLIDMVALQQAMYHYHASLVATHPYASKWWQWPLLIKPISYYYHDFRVGAATADPTRCCLQEILALPNPFVWWLGLISVPAVAALAWIERNKGYALLVGAYVLQWLPWIGSPRIAFEYHFYPNLSIIVLANAIILQRIWNWQAPAPAAGRMTFTTARIGIIAYLAVVVVAFAFFFPVLAGLDMTWNQWHDRMWFPSWII
ncbi:MAG: phospholipid carrier-dependent glycosyltransferase, partial [Candidatus Velthaea sp.]